MLKSPKFRACLHETIVYDLRHFLSHVHNAPPSRSSALVSGFVPSLCRLSPTVRRSYCTQYLHVPQSSSQEETGRSHQPRETPSPKECGEEVLLCICIYNPPPLASTQISLQHSFQILALELSKLTCDCIPFCRIAAIAVGSLVVGYITLKVSLSGKHYFFLQCEVHYVLNDYEMTSGVQCSMFFC